MNNAIKYILSAIVAGAIGNGIWERFLSRYVDSLVSILVETMNAISTSYKDGIYAQASLGFQESYVPILFLWISSLIIAVLPFLFKMFLDEESNKIESNKIESNKIDINKIGINMTEIDMTEIDRTEIDTIGIDMVEKGVRIAARMSLIMSVTIIILSLFIISKINYTNRVVIYSIRSLDIVKPYIPENEHNELVSQFYQVRNTDDYDNFNEKITNIAETYSLRLPKNPPL